jgi:hypothetical protein
VEFIILKFTDQELEYIKKEFAEVSNKIKNEYSKEELLEYMSEVGGKSIDTALTFTKFPDWYERANTQDNLNKDVTDAIFWIGGMWVWADSYYTTADEVAQYIKEEEYCSIFEKIMNEDEELEEC